MAGDFYNADNVVVGHAMLMLTPWVKGAVEPMVDDDTPLFAPDDAGWGADWLSVGATNEGFKVNVETSTTQITIEEQSTPVGETVESKAIGIEAVLAESTMQSIKYSWGGGAITSTAAASGQPGTEKMSLSDDIEYFTATLETRNYNGFARRLYIPKVSITGSGEVSFRRAADKQMFPVRAASLCKPSEIEIVDVVAAALP
jgi:hypothetical protein